jgi:hypothetical protein
MITNLWTLLGMVAILVVVVGVLGFMGKKEWKMIDKFFDNIKPYYQGAIGITVAIIIGVAVAMPLLDLTRDGYLCDSNNWTGIHQTNNKEFWLFGEKITIMCIDDLNQSSDINVVKVIKKSDSIMYSPNLSGLA